MDPQELLVLIKKAKREKWRRVDLSNRGMTYLPPKICNFDSLIQLIVSHNQLTILPPDIKHLTGLTRLDASRNQLAELPSEIGALENLTVLLIGHNSFSTFPVEICQLTNLTRLDLSHNHLNILSPEVGELTLLTLLDLGHNQLAELPSEIGSCVKLTNLRLSGNQLLELPPEICELTNLTTLYLAGNQLSSLPPKFSQLNSLSTLSLFSCQFTTLPPEITQLTSLSKLYLADNQINALPPQIGRLTNLSRLDLEGNCISVVPVELCNLTNLTELYLAKNQIDSLPREIVKLKQLKKLDLRDNPLPIPPEILNQVNNPQAILTYYFEHIDAPTHPLNEIKVILVGEGGVGKTSLVRRMLDNEFDPHEGKTVGINIRRWSREIGGEEVRLNIWDFGGQEIMHATHQFFLTHRSVYVLVLAEREDPRLEYWLGLAESYGGNSPILIVANKIDEHRPDLPERDLKRKHRSIRAFIYTSCKSGYGVDTLKDVLDIVVQTVPHRHDRLTENWFRVKERLEDMASQCDYLTYSSYLEICRDEGIDNSDSQSTLIRFLHDLGAVLHFEDRWTTLQDTMVLNPEWVTGGVYCILNHEPLRTKRLGKLHRDMLDTILDHKAYPKECYPFIIGMMLRFQLCYPLDEEGWYLIPGLLPVNEPDAVQHFGDGLRFEFHYDVLPSSIISRLMVCLHRCIMEGTAWRSGVILANDDNQALVRADTRNNRLLITVRGRETTRTGWLQVIREALRHINSSLGGLHPDERVPIPNHPKGRTVSYKELLKRREKGRLILSLEDMDEDIPIHRLLGGIDPSFDVAAPWRNAPVYISGDFTVVGEIRDSTVALGRSASAHSENLLDEQEAE